MSAPTHNVQQLLNITAAIYYVQQQCRAVANCTAADLHCTSTAANYYLITYFWQIKHYGKYLTNTEGIL